MTLTSVLKPSNKAIWAQSLPWTVAPAHKQAAILQGVYAPTLACCHCAVNPTFEKLFVFSPWRLRARLAVWGYFLSRLCFAAGGVITFLDSVLLLLQLQRWWMGSQLVCLLQSLEWAEDAVVGRPASLATGFHLALFHLLFLSFLWCIYDRPCSGGVTRFSLVGRAWGGV